MTGEESKAKRIAAWVVVGLLTTLFVLSGTMKLIRAEPMVENFENYGLGGKEVLIGAGEITSAVLYAIPLTSSLGVLLLSAHMGGAIMVHMSHGEPYLIQSVVLILVWVGGYLRNPLLLSSFTRRKGRTKD